MIRPLLIFVCMFLSTTVKAEIASVLVSSGAEKVPSYGGDQEFARSIVRMSIDPAVTDWIAWNDSNYVDVTLKPIGVGVDDYICLTITNPFGESMTIDLDRNYVTSQPYGPQAIIFGNSSTSPTISRGNYLLKEDGAFNSLFTTEGDYLFDFSFRDSYGGSASFGSIYLIASVPEPQTIMLSVVGILSLLFFRRKPRKAS